MRKLNTTIIVAVDTGYGNIKTANTVTPTGITAYDSKPTFVGEILQYNNKYYPIGEVHKVILSISLYTFSSKYLILLNIHIPMERSGIGMWMFVRRSSRPKLLKI